jgi:o-succinylbenzoate synthase
VKITRVGVTAFRLPLRAPLSTRTRCIEARRGVLLSLGNDAGVEGFGEGSPLAGFSSDSAPEVESRLVRVAPELLGETLRDPDALFARLACLVGESAAARAALDLALRDLGSRENGRALCDDLASQFGTRPRRQVPVNALLSGIDARRLASAARRAVQQGFRTLKLKLLGPDLEADLQRVSEVRGSVGPDVALRVDANGGFGEEEALAACRALARYDVEYLEQPVPPADVAALARLRRASPIPIAADEAAASTEGARAVLQAQAADVLILKPSLCGGLADALETVRRARRTGVDVVITSSLESAVGIAGALHLAAALPSPWRDCGLATTSLLADDLARIPGGECGTLAVPPGPGLGLGPSREALERLRLGPGREFTL